MQQERKIKPAWHLSARAVALSLFFAAFIALGSYMVAYIGQSPSDFVVLFALLAGLALGGRLGLLSVFLYLLCGALGFNIFLAEASASWQQLAGKEGGYLLGCLPLVFVAGSASSLSDKIANKAIACALGLTCCLLTAFFWFWLEQKLRPALALRQIAQKAPILFLQGACALIAYQIFSRFALLKLRRG